MTGTQQQPRRVVITPAAPIEPVDDGVMISSGQVAKLLGIERGMVRSLVSQGKLPPAKFKTVGGKGRWSRFEIQQIRKAWEAGCTVDFRACVSVQNDEEL